MLSSPANLHVIPAKAGGQHLALLCLVRVATTVGISPSYQESLHYFFMQRTGTYSPFSL